MTKIFYSLIFDDIEIDIKGDKELAAARRVRPFECDHVLPNYLCLNLDRVADDRGVYQLWWWEKSPPAALPLIGQELNVTDSICGKIIRVWMGVDYFAVIKRIPNPERPYTPVFATIR